MRDENGGWRAPSFVTITAGASVGRLACNRPTWLWFSKRNKECRSWSTENSHSEPMFRQRLALWGEKRRQHTDMQLKAEIYSYSRSRGLFAGRRSMAPSSRSIMQPPRRIIVAQACSGPMRRRVNRVDFRHLPQHCWPRLPLIRIPGNQPPHPAAVAAAPSAGQPSDAASNMPPLVPVPGAAPTNNSATPQLGAPATVGTAAYPAAVQARHWRSVSCQPI